MCEIFTQSKNYHENSAITEILAGEPGFAAKLNVARKAPESVGLPVANLASWTTAVAKKQPLRFRCRARGGRTVMRGFF